MIITRTRPITSLLIFFLWFMRFWQSRNAGEAVNDLTTN